MPKLSMKNYKDYLTCISKAKQVHSFRKDISPKVYAFPRLEFDPAYNDILFEHVSHKATWISIL